MIDYLQQAINLYSPVFVFTGSHFFHLMYIFLILPSLNLLYPLIKDKSSNWFYEMYLYAHYPLLLLTLYFYKLHFNPFTLLSLGLIFAQSIRVGRRLHKEGKLIGKHLLAITLYGHVDDIYHNTPLIGIEKNTKLYEFVYKNLTIKTNNINLWENDKLEFIQMWSISIIYLLLSLKFRVIITHILSASISVFYLEIIQYIKNYGNVRWISNEPFYTSLLFEDVENNISETNDITFVLPYGYALTSLLCLCPPKYFKAVNKLLATDDKDDVKVSKAVNNDEIAKESDVQDADTTDKIAEEADVINDEKNADADEIVKEADENVDVDTNDEFVEDTNENPDTDTKDIDVKDDDENADESELAQSNTLKKRGKKKTFVF